MAQELTLDREKYLKILKSDGLSAALTALHRDTERVEYQAFEGRDGYRPDVIDYLERVRDFSRELWRTSIDPQAAQNARGF